jgi:alkylation response protein AidB-like acyl-CoA dehydrogenase
MHFSDEPEHSALLRETRRRFVREEMTAKKRQRPDREHALPRRAFARLAALGVCGLTIDDEFGSHGRDRLAMPIVGGSSLMPKNNIANRLGPAS